jgi:hypothetical protein
MELSFMAHYQGQKYYEKYKGTEVGLSRVGISKREQARRQINLLR